MPVRHSFCSAAFATITILIMPSQWKRSLAAATTVVVALTVLAGCAPERVPGASTTPSPAASASPVAKPKNFFNKTQYSLTDPTSIWVVVNKLRPLQPANFTPTLVTLDVPHVSAPQMTQEAGDALLKMFAAAAAAGAGQLQIQNSYRSYSVQVNTHNSLVASLGQAAADAQSARPGYSEHQTGLAVDVAAYPSKCDIAACFGQTPQGIWLAANSWQYGYILRYPADKTAITGYIYEPWHFRYVGVALSTEMHNDGIETMEEFFGLPAAPDYAGATG
jgi:D-alanyl-D-alanine carboxypeptidase